MRPCVKRRGPVYFGSSRWMFVSFSVKIVSSGAIPSVPPTGTNRNCPSVLWLAITASPSSHIPGRVSSPASRFRHDQLFRSVSVGATVSAAASGPRFEIVRRDQRVFRAALRVLHLHVEVALLVEDPRVQQFVLRLLEAALVIHLHQLRHTETHPADICRAPWRSYGSASRPGSKTAPSRPRRGCPRCSQARTAAPSESRRARSTATSKSTAGTPDPSIPADRPRPTGTPGTAPCHA